MNWLTKLLEATHESNPQYVPVTCNCGVYQSDGWACECNAHLVKPMEAACATS
jgi:hypothetical protein